MSPLRESDSQVLAELRKDVDLIKKALLGDLTVSKESRGLIANLLAVMDDLYKNGSGIKGRVQRLEEYRIRVVGYCAGVSFAVGALVYLADHFLTHK